MELKELFDKTNIKYVIHKKNRNFEYIEFENESIVIIIKNDTNIFKIRRKDFFEIDDMLLPYVFLLIDESKKEKYLVKVKEPHNELRHGFDSTEKDEIYFGKQILQNKKKDEDIIKELKMIGS